MIVNIALLTAALATAAWADGGPKAYYHEGCCEPVIDRKDWIFCKKTANYDDNSKCHGVACVTVHIKRVVDRQRNLMDWVPAGCDYGLDTSPRKDTGPPIYDFMDDGAAPNNDDVPNCPPLDEFLRYLWYLVITRDRSLVRGSGPPPRGTTTEHNNIPHSQWEPGLKGNHDGHGKHKNKSKEGGLPDDWNTTNNHLGSVNNNDMRYGKHKNRSKAGRMPDGSTNSNRLGRMPDGSTNSNRLGRMNDNHEAIDIFSRSLYYSVIVD